MIPWEVIVKESNFEGKSIVDDAMTKLYGIVFLLELQKLTTNWLIGHPAVYGQKLVIFFYYTYMRQITPNMPSCYVWKTYIPYSLLTKLTFLCRIYRLYIVVAAMPTV